MKDHTLRMAIIVGTRPEIIKREGNNPFGDGQSSKKIVNILEERL